jgi:RNA polymerase sigma-70 factor (ECF subfamily)
MTEAGARSLAEMLDERRHLLEIALWMFGSAATADRIVQETYRRWYALNDEERAGIAVPRAWLTRVAGGICLESLATPAAFRPPSAVPRADSVPAPVADGPALRGGTVRRRSGQPFRKAMLDRHDRVARRFAAACDTGDVAALKAVLASDALVVSDGGGKLRTSVRPTYGADAVAQFIAALLAGPPGIVVTIESVNGRTGLALRRAGHAVAVVSVSVAGTEVTAVWIVLNPDKLQHWHRP